MYKSLSALAGVLVAIMIAFNGILSNSIGNNTATVLIHLVGLIGVSFIILASRRKMNIHNGIPLYLYSAGAIGVFTVIFTNISFIRLGASLTCALSLLGQSTASIVLDHYGLLEMKVVRFKKEKIFGLVLISLGIVIMTLY